MGRIALCGLLLLSLSGCLGLGLASMPANTVVLSTNAPVVDESVPARQTGRGTDPEVQLARSAAQTERWRRTRPVDFSELDRPTGAPAPDPKTLGAAAPTGAAGVEMRAAPPAARAARSHPVDPGVDSVTALDRLETRARSAARPICDRC